MNAIRNTFERGINYISTIGVADVLDIVLVAFLFYQVIMLMRKTNASNLVRGLLLFIAALWLSALMKLTMVNYILRKAVEIGLIAIIILFQPELRRILERLGSRISPDSRVTGGATIENAITQTVVACREMSDERTGALIIFERGIKLNDIIDTGTVIDSEVSSELLKNIFYNKAPLHDGAVIIRDGRLAAAGCVLPLTKSTNLSKDLGMRHRAGIGLSEQSDAVVVIVSEQTGSISCSIQGMLKRHLKPSMLDRILRNELITSGEVKNKGFLSVLRYALGISDEKEDVQ